ncbi:MAG: arginine--tRNA ligase [Syntrophomonadaceae bacterium]|jgi:arginyl-tRNA synthetase|nr:arginine--tRNA ligase [Syntrophomonadaceae bacterium]
MNPVEEIKSALRSMIMSALEKAQAEQALSIEAVPDFVIEVPREKEHGDFACNVAMLLAKSVRRSPREIARIIVDHLDKEAVLHLDRVMVAGAGFINMYLRPGWLYSIPALVIQMGEDYGSAPRNGKKVQVEFVSANPTGNLHMGNARGGAIGDTLANVLHYAGYDVEREFYINDAGNQIELFAQSLEARYLQLCGFDIPFPENGYAGQDVVDTVKNIIASEGDSLLAVESSARQQKLADLALQEKLAYMRETLRNFGIEYDVWFSEKELHDSGQVAAVIEELRQKGYIYEKDGAQWFKTTLWGDEKDEVVVRANGVPTYFAADIAYHKDKFKRGFDWVINVWGADHHGHVARMKGAMAALGFDPAQLDVILMQLVRLYRGGQIVRMSKRTGTTVSLDELIEEVGKDAARFTFVMRNPDSHLDFDMELAKQQSMENPVYYVQYAHARICSIFRQAEALGVKWDQHEKTDLSVLNQAEEIDILRKIAEFPMEVEAAAKTLAPHRIARYSLDLAALFHSYYNHFRVLQEDPVLQSARLTLMKAVQIVIANALAIVGVTAPDHM